MSGGGDFGRAAARAAVRAVIGSGKGATGGGGAKRWQRRRQQWAPRAQRRWWGSERWRAAPGAGRGGGLRLRARRLRAAGWRRLSGPVAVAAVSPSSRLLVWGRRRSSGGRPARGGGSRVGTGSTLQGRDERCVSCTTFNILAPIYKRMDSEGGPVQELHYFPPSQWVSYVELQEVTPYIYLLLQKSEWWTSNGSLYYCTLVDPIFIFIPIFEAARMLNGKDSGNFRQLDEILYIEGYPGYRHLMSVAGNHMELVCEVKEVANVKFFRLDNSNVLSWLCCKTYTGSILIAVNPFTRLPHLYNEYMMERYKGVRLGELSPHVFAVADASHRAMVNESQSQSILVSGESGAGKIETTKLIMQYLTYVGGRAALDDRAADCSLSLASFQMYDY